MYSIEEKLDWIKSHIWKYSPVWFSGRYCFAIYDANEVYPKDGRLYFKMGANPSKDDLDITYYRLTAFKAEDSEELVQYGYEPIEILYQEDKQCMAVE